MSVHIVYVDADVTYELEVDYREGSPAKLYGPPEDCYPGDGGEVSLPPFVRRWLSPDHVEDVTLETFVRECAIQYGIDMGQAWRMVHDKVTESCMDDLAAREEWSRY